METTEGAEGPEKRCRGCGLSAEQLTPTVDARSCLWGRSFGRSANERGCSLEEEILSTYRFPTLNT